VKWGVRSGHLPAGVVDAGVASFTSFLVGLYVVRQGLVLAGSWGLFFAAFRVAAVVSTFFVFVPSELKALRLPVGNRMATLSDSLRHGSRWALYASPIVGLPILLGLASRPEGLAASDLVAFGASGIVCGFLSPIQDHLRRMLHLDHASPRAAATSIVYGLVTVAALPVVKLLLGVAWAPFTALAIGNLVSLLVSVRLAGRPHPDHAGREPELTTSRELLTQEVLFQAGDLLANGVVWSLAGPTLLGYAENARLVARPVIVLTEGIRSTLGLPIVEAAQRRDAAGAKRAAVRFRRLTLWLGIPYLLATGWAWPGNPLSSVAPDAYTITGLAVTTVAANVALGLLSPERNQLMGRGNYRGLLQSEWGGTFARLVVTASAPITKAFAIPVGLGALVIGRWIGYTRALASDTPADKVAKEEGPKSPEAS